MVARSSRTVEDTLQGPMIEPADEQEDETIFEARERGRTIPKGNESTAGESAQPEDAVAGDAKALRTDIDKKLPLGAGSADSASAITTTQGANACGRCRICDDVTFTHSSWGLFVH